MTRLLVHVEGETEESFVNEVLSTYLYHRGHSIVSARLMGNARQRHRRGGARAWTAVRKDILNHLREDSESFATTMVDYYGLPRSGPRAWPGRETAAGVASSDKGKTVEAALLSDVREQMGAGFNPHRFLPYVMMHEFEALLFSDCQGFGRGIGRPEIATDLQKIRNDFPNPEAIDDSPDIAPSKRVEALVAGYQKPLLGVLAAIEIGLDPMRAECPHFGGWLDRLERLPAAPAGR